MFNPTSTNHNGNCRNTRCGKNQGAQEAINEGIADGWYPETAHVGPSTKSPRPDNAIAEVTVHPRISYWIVE